MKLNDGELEFLAAIKTWTESEGKKDLDILDAATNPEPRWPWSSAEDFANRLADASRRRIHRETIKHT